MKRSNIFSGMLTSALLLGMTSGIIFAQTVNPVATVAPTGTRLEVREAALQKRALTEITARLNSLTKIIAVLNGIKKISDSDRTALLTQVQTEIQNLQALETKIQSDTDVTILRTDVQSITKAFRVYWLFLPKIHVLAASDRINEATVLMLNVVNKLQSRINAAGTAGVSLQTTLDDAKAKIADAQTQASNAINLVTALQPDNGDKNVLAANVAALKSARTDIQTARTDLRKAYQDFKTIVQTLKSLKVTTSITSVVTPTP